MSTDGSPPPGVTDYDVDQAAGGHDPCHHRNAHFEVVRGVEILVCDDCGEEIRE